MCNGMCVTRHQVINHEMSVSISKKKKNKLLTVSLRNGQYVNQISEMSTLAVQLVLNVKTGRD